MSVVDTGEGWLAEFPGKSRQNVFHNEVGESGPCVSVLRDRVRRTSTKLKVEYRARNPVTITWHAGGEQLASMTDGVRESRTTLTLNSQWLGNHPGIRYTVTVKDQKLSSRHGANSVSSSCTVTVPGH